MRRFVPIAAVLALVLASATPTAQQPKYLDKATFFEMESVSNPQISPDRKSVV